MSKIADALIEDAEMFGVDPATFTEVTAEPIMFQSEPETPVITVMDYCDWYNIGPIPWPTAKPVGWLGLEQTYRVADMHAVADQVLTAERLYRRASRLHQRIALWAGVAA